MIEHQTIDRVRQHIGLAELIGETVRLQKRGRSFVGLCPFHKEKTPSFHVNEERGFYYCFGCGQKGDAIKFVQETEGLSFVEAIRLLAERAGIEIVENVSEGERREQAEIRRRQHELYEVNEVAAAFFERMLREHPLRRHATAELERRELVADTPTGPIADALQAFRVGYAPPNWDALALHLRSAGLSHQAAERVGLLVPKRSGAGHYDRFRHRLMFAVIDLQGRVVGFSGRALEAPSEAELADIGVQPSPTREDERIAKYVNSPESPVYRKRDTVFGLYQAKQHLRGETSCLIVEGNFDVVSLHARGIKTAAAPLGTAFTLEQARLIKRFCPSVTLLFDADDAGRRAVRASREPCIKAGLYAKVATLPDGTDPDEFSRVRGAEALTRVIGSAQGLLEYLVDTALDRSFSLLDARTRVAKINEVAELLKEEDDPTVRAMAEQHADRIAERLGIADQRTFRALAGAVRRALDQPAQPDRAHTGTAIAEPPARARSRDRRAGISEEILGALLDYPQLLDTPEVVDAAAVIEGDLAAAIAALRQWSAATAPPNPEEILAKLPPSIHPFALARLAAPRHERLDDAKTELFGNLIKLKRLELERRKCEVVEELQRVSKTGDFEQELTLLREQVSRSRQRHGLGDS